MNKNNLCVCEICKKEFGRITPAHLWVYHKMTLKEYKEKYPGANLGYYNNIFGEEFYAKNK